VDGWFVTVGLVWYTGYAVLRLRFTVTFGTTLPSVVGAPRLLPFGRLPLTFPVPLPLPAHVTFTVCVLRCF